MKNRNGFSLVASSSATLALLAFNSLGCSHGITGADPTPTASAQTQQDLAPAAAPVRTFDLYKVPVEGLPAMGRADAPVTIVEFTDYECPFCQRAEQTMARVRAKYGDAVRVVVAELPLPFHDRARPAALAALAADAQGKFEPMHARLFALGGALSEEAITGAARDAGLDLARFETDRSAAPIATSEKLAKQLGVQGTPAFFIDGRHIVGAQPFETFVDVIDERLAAARSAMTSGVRARDVYAQLTATGADHVAADGTPGKAGGGCDEGAGCDQDCDKGPPETPSEKVETVSIEGAPVRGPSRAAITIVAFGDYECPFTAKGEQVLHAVEAAHPNDVRVVFRNVALPIHAHARLAALAALAADGQGRFWEFHDRLFSAGVSLDREGLTKIATDLHLDVARFSRDLDDPKLADRMTRDQADADALDVKGTPTFFVNGRRIVGAQPASAFEAAIARAR